MAKPIEPTPTLRGKDAIRFIQNMVKEEKNPSPERIKFIRESMKIKFNVVKRA
ncbi:MAG: hypothetical protein AABY40_04525 [Nanoarchaeota archaeon]